MTNDTRSLWEVYESETEPWKKGRSILILTGLFYFVMQALIFAATVLSGFVETTVILAGNAVVFWFLFYLIWVGVHWIRWVCGAWNMILGFCLIIWGWRDSNPIVAALGVIAFIIGVCFCLSPSVYLFARRQRENMRWQEAVLIGVVCFFVLGSLGIGFVGLQFVHQQRETEASRFSDEVAQKIYSEQDIDWALAHVSPRSLQNHGQERMKYFLIDTTRQLGKFEHISAARAVVRMSLQLPSTFTATAQVTSEAKTSRGTVELHAVLLDVGQGWEIDRMWWEPLARKQDFVPGEIKFIDE